MKSVSDVVKNKTAQVIHQDYDILVGYVFNKRIVDNKELYSISGIMTTSSK